MFDGPPDGGWSSRLDGVLRSLRTWCGGFDAGSRTDHSIDSSERPPTLCAGSGHWPLGTSIAGWALPLPATARALHAGWACQTACQWKERKEGQDSRGRHRGGNFQAGQVAGCSCPGMVTWARTSFRPIIRRSPYKGSTEAGRHIQRGPYLKAAI